MQEAERLDREHDALVQWLCLAQGRGGPVASRAIFLTEIRRRFSGSSEVRADFVDLDAVAFFLVEAFFVPDTATRSFLRLQVKSHLITKAGVSLMLASIGQ